MRVKFKQVFRGFQIGDEFTVADDTAREWINKCIAEIVAPAADGGTDASPAAFDKLLDSPPRDKAVKRQQAQRK